MDNQQIAGLIKNRRDQLAEATVVTIYEHEPELMERFGETGREKSVRDLRYNLTYLAEAIATESMLLFTEYLSWLKVVLKDYPGLAEGLAGHMDHTQTVLHQSLPKETHATIDTYIQSGIETLTRKAAVPPPSFIDKDSPQGELAQKYLDALLQGQRHHASRLVLEAVEDGIRVRDIYLNVFQPAQHEVGRLWQTNQASVAQEHYCTAATQLIMSQLYPYIFTTEKIGRRLLATSVGDELHEIGVRMVADFFEMDGWDTYYLGANTPLEDILKTAAQYNVDVLGISATMTYHVSTVTDLIAAVRATEVNPNLKILVGGYPFNIDPQLWQRVNADGYAQNAQDAINTANRLVGENQ